MFKEDKKDVGDACTIILGKDKQNKNLGQLKENALLGEEMRSF